jgi:RNA polymerase sigma-70 factor (ECF subfamily)
MTAVAHVWSDFERVRPRARSFRLRPVAESDEAPDPIRLIQAIAARGDRAAFAALFSHFAPRVKGYLLRLGASAASAEELAQETMLAVWRKAALFDPSRAGASTWIFTIARNLRIDALRRDRPAPAEGDPSDERPEPQADAVMLAAEREARVRAALKALPPEQVEIVELSFFSEEPHSAIAERLGLPLGTVKSRLRLAMGRLRAILEDVR